MLAISTELEETLADLVAGDRAAARRAGEILTGPDAPKFVDQIAAAAAAGSTVALDVLIDAVVHHGWADVAIRRYTFDPDTIADIRQEVLISVGRSIGSYRGDAAFKTWLYRIAANAAIGYFRKNRVESPLDEDRGPNARYVSSMVASRAALVDALETLPDAYRRAVMLRDIEQMSYQEIADLLDTNLNTVKSHVARGRSHAARALGDPREP